MCGLAVQFQSIAEGMKLGVFVAIHDACHRKGEPSFEHLVDEERLSYTATAINCYEFSPVGGCIFVQ